MSPALTWIAVALLLLAAVASFAAGRIDSRRGDEAKQRQKRLIWTAVPLFAVGGLTILVNAFVGG